MIIRAAKRPRYVVVRQESMRDFTLSFKARGLLAYILSFPDHWKIDYRSLLALGATEAAKAGVKPKDGADSIKAALRELREAGYLELRRKQNAAGQFGEWETILYESPLENPDYMARKSAGDLPSDLPDENPMSGKPAHGELNNNTDERENRSAGNPMSGKPAHIRNTVGVEIPTERNTVEGENTFSPAAAPLASEGEGIAEDTAPEVPTKRGRGRPPKAEKFDSTQPGGKVPGPKPRKAASEPQGPPAGALGEFYQAFLSARGKPPIFANVATAARQASKLREREGAEGFAACLRYFFTGDDWYRQKGFPFSLFFSQFETISASVEADGKEVPKNGTLGNTGGYIPGSATDALCAEGSGAENAPGPAPDPAAARASARLAAARQSAGGDQPGASF